MYRFARAVLRPIMTPWVRIEATGEDHIPEHGPAILVFNHLSEVDPLCLCWFFMKRNMPVRFLAKKSLFDVPVFGAIISAMGLIPVDREGDAARSLDAAKEALARGEVIIIMPEGTLTQDPDMWPMTFKTGAARLALDTGAPIVPAAQWGPQDIKGPYTSSIDVRPGRSVRYTFRPALDLSDVRTQAGSADREAVATAVARMHHEVRAGVEELRGVSAPETIWQAGTQSGPWWEAELKERARKEKKTAKKKRKADEVSR